ncbi:hypothetical protein evm_014850, partial [Chilo suppressalis]
HYSSKYQYGLPVSKSSRQHLWPILCNIFEIPAVPSFVIGIYAGDAKPSNLDAYLRPFINEMKQLENGFTVTTKTETDKNMQGKIRAFICDSPARAMIKAMSLHLSGKVATAGLPVGDAAVRAASQQLTALRLEAYAHEQSVGIHHLPS